MIVAKMAGGQTTPRGDKLIATAPPGYSVAMRQDAGSEDKNYIAALARGLSVIRAFAYQRDQLTLAEISRIVELPRATVRRCLITLETLGYVETDGKYFRLTPKVLILSQAFFSSTPLPHIARSHIEQVSSTLGESCSVSVLSGDEVIYVVRSTRKRSASVHREVGVNLPAYCTSMGRVLLANLSDEELAGYFRRVTPMKFNAKTVSSEPQLRAILQEVREADFAIIDGELEPNLRAIAVPIRNIAGVVVAAAHVSTEASRATIEKMKDVFLPVLRSAVADIRRGLVR